MFKNSVDKENIAVMYLRLSKEDGEKVESNSISNQREIINSYAKKNQFIIIKEYVDDGYSGANFDRPNFKEMIKDAYDKKFDTIIVKDLSRFGRDYIEAGKFIQRIFPENRIRFISVNDNYDSKSANMNDTHLILPIKNFINDSYCRDISNKVKSSQKIKREKGDFISAFAPYGYKKSEENKNKLVIDEQAAPNIKHIFDMKLMGYSSKAIADELNHLGVLTPRKYKESQGFKCNGFQNIKGGNWSAKAVNRIIENEVYIGNTLQGKSITLNYKTKKQIEKEKEDWIRVENTHDAIISKEVFSIANTMLKRDLNNSRGKDRIDIFTGMLFCKECGRHMGFRCDSRQKKNPNKVYKYRNYYCYFCKASRTPNNVKERDIIELIRPKLDEFKLQNTEKDKKTMDYEKIKEEYLREISALNSNLQIIYENYKKNSISKEEYLRKKILVQDRKKLLENKIKELENVEDDSKKELDINNLDEDNLLKIYVDNIIDKIIASRTGEIEIIEK